MSSTRDNTNKNKREGLNALRGIGIAGIVLYHLFPTVFQGGFLGVPLFFVLSGYLMFTTGDIAWKKGAFHIGSYYKKRIRKIYPPLFIMVMAVCCVMTLTHNRHLIGIRREISSIFLGYNNWWQIKQNTSYFSKLGDASPFTHLWFLAVEMQFYLIWPFLFILYKKGCDIIGRTKMCFSFLLLAFLSAGKMFILYVPGSDPSRVYYGTDTMAFPLLLGMFLGAVRKEYPQLQIPRTGKKTIPILLTFVLILCALFFLVNGNTPFLYQGGMFLLSLLFAGIVLLIENHSAGAETPKFSPLLSFLGEKSYELYLWHYPVIVLALIHF